MSDISRRSFLASGLGLYTAALVPSNAFGKSNELREYTLSAQQGSGYLLGAPYPRTSAWTYNQSIPGPIIRAKQGQRLKIELTNQLQQPTTLHCHGIRLPNAMDGVPEMTQAPIKPGETFVYEFDVPDAGTYWYHPHFNSAEQVARGLYGALIVEEKEPIRVDREAVLIFDDWRVTDDLQISADFDNGHDRSHGGRTGNLITTNGVMNPEVNIRSGERVRLRLINAANARTFVLDFSSQDASVIAIDGHPVTPHKPENGRIVLGAAMRVDLIIDMMAAPKSRFQITTQAYRDENSNVLQLVYSNQSALREQPLASSIQLDANTQPEPNLDEAVHHSIEIAGGAMGGMREANLNGKRTSIRQLAQQGYLWALNGEVGVGHTQAPLLSLKQGQSYVMSLSNKTAFAHPMHLHGYAFRVISRDGNPTKYRQWQDTVMISRNETLEIAFVADNPGDWMYHCHVLEHQISGMTGYLRVA